MKKLLLCAVLAVMTLAGCAGGITAPQSPQQAVYTAKQTYLTALNVAVAYKKLPACKVPAQLPCSDVAIVAQVQKADNVAAPALDAAESAVRQPGFGSNAITTAVSAAQAAVSAFVAITANFGSK